MLSKKEMRRRIMKAAKKRFTHYGYGKTTMAELACDCDMSPGNLYRYFTGKILIAEALAIDVHKEIMAALRDVISKPGLSAAEKIKLFLHEELFITFKRIEASPHFFEMAQDIKKKNVALINQELKELRGLLIDILVEGNDNGELSIEDTALTAEMIQCATWKFRYPQLITKLSLEKLEEELNGVTSLILRGLGVTERVS